MMTSDLDNYFDYYEIKENFWEEIVKFQESRFQPGSHWVFRGQSGSNRGLKTSIEREIEMLDMDLEQAPDIERGLLRSFKRSCHHYIRDTPEENASLEWLALMQHHGAPTRLLDWTYSFYAALFFAIEYFDKNGYTVWAFNTDGDWMNPAVESILGKYPFVLQCWNGDKAALKPETFSKIFNHKDRISMVGVVNPFRLNERLVIQRGVFLCPGDVSQSFEDNLIAVLHQSNNYKENFIKIKIETRVKDKCDKKAVRKQKNAKRAKEVRKDIFQHLQGMNMNRATLFPGLDGFAASLKTSMANPESFLAPGDEEL